MKNIGIIDADLLGRKRHRFPNLASMKISGYHKEKDDNVTLLLDYENLYKYDLVYISKVFTDTKIDDEVLKLHNVKYGGTGFFYDKAEPLPCEIEHHMPDYNLYDKWVNYQLENGVKRKDLTYYLDYSIGFTTRGCFRKCSFCVNKNYSKVSKHSELNEFVSEDRKYICLLDDNILGYKDWEGVFEELNDTGKRFQYKQGMDERTLNDDKVNTILNSNYIGDIIFAFDDIKDKNLIENKLSLWRKYDTRKTPKFYVFCGFDRNDVYNDDFWEQDIKDTFERIKVLMKYKSIPYIMRHENYNNSPYKGMYITIARWCNQPSFYKKKSFKEFCLANGENSASMRYMREFENKYPEVAEKYFNLKYDKLNQYK